MKKEIRKEMIAIRDSHSKEQLDKLSKEIIDNLFNWQKYKNAKTVMLYSSIKSEVRTNSAIILSINERKTIVLPKTLKEKRELLPCVVKDMKELEAGVYGILEPKCFSPIDKNDIDIVIIPGVAFDYKGYRIGYGAGYYDRFLLGYKGIKAGMCYNFQIIEDVFHDIHDIRMDYLISEKGIIKTGDIL